MNVCKDVVKQLVKEVAVFATDGQFEMEALEFEKNHRGEDDVALFDFTSLFAAEHASRVIEREGKRLLTCLVGDTLIEVRTYWDNLPVYIGILCQFTYFVSLERPLYERPPSPFISPALLITSIRTYVHVCCPC